MEKKSLKRTSCGAANSLEWVWVNWGKTIFSPSPQHPLEVKLRSSTTHCHITVPLALSLLPTSPTEALQYKSHLYWGCSISMVIAVSEYLIPVSSLDVTLGNDWEAFGYKAVGQLCSTANVSHNLQQCQLLVKKAVAAGAKVPLPHALALGPFQSLTQPEFIGIIPPRSQRLQCIIVSTNCGSCESFKGQWIRKRSPAWGTIGEATNQRRHSRKHGSRWEVEEYPYLDWWKGRYCAEVSKNPSVRRGDEGRPCFEGKRVRFTTPWTTLPGWSVTKECGER